VRAVLTQLTAAERKTGGKSRRILITAGPTREAVDPVRYLSNRSSGRMGYALAEAAVAAGHEVTLISGPSALPRPAGCRFIPVVTAAEMAVAVKREFPATDILIMSAAVADYRPVAPTPRKIKKSARALTLALEPTEDILASVAAARKRGQKVVGFAAETEKLEAAAQEKLRRKKLDWIVANDVSRSDIGFDSEQNEVTVFASGTRPVRLERMPKSALAARLLALFTAP
jgi:phosphopantothenoylcysteine synthetase/decarboxylase